MAGHEDEKHERDALCPDCGHGFRVYTGRIMPGDKPPAQKKDVQCPHCGCRECKLQDSIH